MKSKYTLLTGAVLGGLGVALGAFGAHALKSTLALTGRTETYELAVRYQFYHALALLMTGLLLNTLNNTFIRWSTTLLLSGTILFSGSLYILCFTGITQFAYITPIGGVVLLLGWASLVTGILRSKQ